MPQQTNEKYNFLKINDLYNHVYISGEFCCKTIAQALYYSWNIVEPLLGGHPFCTRKWPLVGGRYQYIDIQVAFPDGLTSRQGGLSKGVPLYMYAMVWKAQKTHFGCAVYKLERPLLILSAEIRNFQNELQSRVILGPPS